ncbi:carboxylate-amine ligase [Actinokineospora alba]|uniref:carboxylate-amine ligase n=1 Tax=Actinokineospora alba TaxID=504798 RepID=UPI000B8783D1|nr:glutamate--cysteine ligase [Actinokineospora alba]
MRSPAPCPSVGVEEEFFLVDPATGALLPHNVAVVESARLHGVELDLELLGAQVETKTTVCWTMREVRAQVLATRAAAAAAAVRSSARLVATGVSLGDDRDQPLTDKQRYARMADVFGPMAREHAVCGCHIHVAVPDRETAVQVSNHLRPWLPILLALTANSAVHRGRDTGYASWRSIMWSRWPSGGPPPYFTSAEHYDSLVAMMMESGMVLDKGMVYWDIRPSHHLPTVEVRVSDVPATVDETTLLAALVRALVATAIRATQAGTMALPVPPEVLRAAYWRAARDGMEGAAMDVATSRRVPPNQILVALMRHVRDELEDSGERQQVEKLLRKVLAQGNGATWQRRTLAAHGNLSEVVTVAARRTLQGTSPRTPLRSMS